MFEGIGDHQRQQGFEELRVKREENLRQVGQTFDPRNTKKQNNKTYDEEKNQYIEIESKLTQILVFAHTLRIISESLMIKKLSRDMHSIKKLNQVSRNENWSV